MQDKFAWNGRVVLLFAGSWIFAWHGRLARGLRTRKRRWYATDINTSVSDLRFVKRGRSLTLVLIWLEYKPTSRTYCDHGRGARATKELIIIPWNYVSFISATFNRPCVDSQRTCVILR